MKTALSRLVAIIVLTFPTLTCFAQQQGQQQQKELNVPEQAEKEAARLEGLLKLEDWQVFKVDSMLNVNLEGFKEEMEVLKRSGAQNQSSYYSVNDKWAEKMDSAYMKIFNLDQWTKYQKNGAAHAKRDREKRKADAEKAGAALRNGGK
jgi:hypothetical protein